MNRSGVSRPRLAIVCGCIVCFISPDALAATKPVVSISGAPFATNVLLTLQDIDRLSVRTIAEPKGRMTLAFRLTSKGVAKFDTLTRLLSQQGSKTHRLQHLVFAVDGHIYARESIDYRLYPQGLDGRNGLEFAGLPRSSALKVAREVRTK